MQFLQVLELHFPSSEFLLMLCSLRSSRVQSSPRGRAVVIGGLRQADDLGSREKDLPDGAQQLAGGEARVT